MQIGYYGQGSAADWAVISENRIPWIDREEKGNEWPEMGLQRAAVSATTGPASESKSEQRQRGQWHRQTSHQQHWSTTWPHTSRWLLKLQYNWQNTQHDHDVRERFKGCCWDRDVNVPWDKYHLLNWTGLLYIVHSMCWGLSEGWPFWNTKV